MYDLKFSEPSLTSWALLRQTWAVMDKVAEIRLAKVGLTPEKIAVLWACKEHPGPLIPAEIARFVSRESQSVTGLLNRMEREGLVTRIPKRKGKPFTEIRLTSKGEDICQKGIAIMKKVIDEQMTTLKDEERKQLDNRLRALRQQAVENLHIELTTPPNVAEDKNITLKW